MRISDLAKYCEDIKASCSNCKYENDCQYVVNRLQQLNMFSIKNIFDDNQYIEEILKIGRVLK